jgi:hypothetical protein
MKTKTSLSLTATAGIALIITATATHAATVAPVSWKQSNSINTARTADKLSNATGMNGAETILYNLDGTVGGEPTSADNVSWMTSSNGDESTASEDGRVWLVVDLGASYDLGTIAIWNFQWNLGTVSDLSDRGVSQFDIFVRNTVADTSDGTVGGATINLDNPADDTGNALDDDAVFNLGSSNLWQEVLSNQSLTQGPNTDTYTGQSFDLTGNTGRFVAIRVDAYYGGSGIALGKLRVDGTLVPEPTTAALLGLGGLTLILSP